MICATIGLTVDTGASELGKFTGSRRINGSGVIKFNAGLPASGNSTRTSCTPGTSRKTSEVRKSLEKEDREKLFQLTYQKTVTSPKENAKNRRKGTHRNVSGTVVTYVLETDRRWSSKETKTLCHRKVCGVCRRGRCRSVC